MSVLKATRFHAGIVLVALAAMVVPLPAHGQEIAVASLPRCFPLSSSGPDGLWDYGDAPDNTNDPAMTTFYSPPGSPIGFFPTLAGTINTPYFPQPGARHRVVDVGWLGNNAAYPPFAASFLVPADVPPSREADADLFPDPDPTTNLWAGTPDHDLRDDGLYPAVLPTNGLGALRFRVSTTSGVLSWYVNIAIDWTFDGDWQDVAPNGAPEWVVQDMLVSVPPFQSTTFTTAPFATGPTPGAPWLRITLSDTPILPTGIVWDGVTPPGTFDAFGNPAFECGETEDYCDRKMLWLNPNQTPKEFIFCEPHA